MEHSTNTVSKVCGNKSGTVNINDLSIDSIDPDLLSKASIKWKQYGCFVVRGLNKSYVGSISQQVQRTVIQSIALEKAGILEAIKEGWVTPDGTLFIPAAWDGTKYEKNRESVVIEDVAKVQKGTTHVAQTDANKNNLPESALHNDGTVRDKQIMVLGLDYNTSSALLRCAMDKKTLDVVSAIFCVEADKERQLNGSSEDKVWYK